MIKNLLNSDSDEADAAVVSSASRIRSGSILDLDIPEDLPESFDPFAISDNPPIPEAEQRIADNSSVSSLMSEDKRTNEMEYFAPTAAESVRMSGLAWSAGIMFFGSVGFMLVLGWLVDTLLGSSPWGIVGGIVLGSVIGFVQLLRINTQILKTPSGGPRSLLQQASGAVEPESPIDIVASNEPDIVEETPHLAELETAPTEPSAHAEAVENDDSLRTL